MKVLSVQNIVKHWRNLSGGSINRQILGAAITVGLGTALIKIVAVFKELIVAWKFGIGDTLDAFLIAMLVPDFIIIVVAGSFHAALIPTYIQVREQEGINAAQKLFSGVMLWSLGLLLITTILMLATAPLYLPQIAAGFSAEKLDLTFKLLWVIAPVVMLNGILLIWGAVLNAGERFALAAVCPIMTPAITIIFLLLNKSWGVFALAAGLVGGAVLEIILLGAAIYQQGVLLELKWYGLNAHLHQVINQFFPAMAGSFLIGSAAFVDQSMAAMLSPGSVAALNYGQRAIAFPISLVTTALGTAVIPYSSKMIACKDWQGVQHTLKHYLQLIFVVTVPLTGILIVFSEPIVQILFQRGSFTAEDTHLVAQIQSCFALQIPFYIGNILVVKFITSMQLNHILMWAAGFDLIINITLNYLFMQWIGIKGIALSTSCVYLFTFLFVFLLITKKLRELSK
ncbi:lipid II flippase MurJ [Chlorogloeopsis sp. ULAP01]|uniref:murein biosynthesis integral membrane protein MurJ n=1 Tax=Chlorogloeopsis sp. ULAP01 TaxID=3056483 RepID=UPI0025AA80A1|nr:lipid II flippase MurJ [Chlorogloeopsis sp. ULAP01]MDM9381272.1 lipid II flippase MurJ [Chlorogloeopsis sp. ULAP01]